MTSNEAAAAPRVRRVRPTDMPDVIALDAKVTGLSKSEYWHDVYHRYGRR